MNKPKEVREQLTKSIVLDLIGPIGAIGDQLETIPQQPSKWYLTGFLVPTESSEAQKTDETVTEQLDQSAAPSSGDETDNPEPPVARRSFLPSSCGISFLIAAKSRSLQAIVRWGDYERLDKEKPQSPNHWKRKPREQIIDLKVGDKPTASVIIDVPDSGGIQLVWNSRALNPHHGGDDVPKGTRSISVFLVNRRIPAGDDFADEAFVFQVELEIHGDVPFVPRPNLATLESNEWDQLVADIQYRDTCEFSVGHAISTEAVVEDGKCVIVRSVWIPSSQVERVAPASIHGVELRMDTLSELTDGEDAKAKLGPLVQHYREWIDEQSSALNQLSSRRNETCEEMIKNAKFASKRIELGIELLNDPKCLEAFRIANRAMADQGRRRLALALKKPASEIVPEWRPFQLAFILMNLKGIAEPTHDDRELVDLLFFPTG